MKIVINKGNGKFELSQLALQNLAEIGWTIGEYNIMYSNKVEQQKHKLMRYSNGDLSLNIWEHNTDSIKFRSNPDIIKVFEGLNYDALEDYSEYADIEIYDIPVGIEVYISRDCEDGGFETIHEKHRTWGYEGSEG